MFEYEVTCLLSRTSMLQCLASFCHMSNTIMYICINDEKNNKNFINIHFTNLIQYL